jgi:ribosomal protein S18 acetylase RimI-like enzyme
MEVRAARPEDYDAAGRVTADAYREFVRADDVGWDEYLAEIGDVAGRAQGVPVLVAVEDGRILGSATIELDDRVVGDEEVGLSPEMANLRMLGVDPSTRGRGVGRALVEASIGLARSAGKSIMVLHTTDRMTRAERLYRSMGFERDPERDQEFEDGLRLLAYRRPI